MIFVDTSAWFARFASKDANHPAAVAFVDANLEQLITTDGVLDETLTLFRSRGFDRWAYYLGAELLAGRPAALIHVTEEDVQAAWRVFDSHRDKHWSFTDCTSFVVMKRLGINQAFAFDDHFRQFGFITVLP